jgi:hypothetical protein
MSGACLAVDLVGVLHVEFQVNPPNLMQAAVQYAFE